MSLGLNVDAGTRRGARRAVLALAATMCAMLLLSAWNGWQVAEGEAADSRRWRLPLVCAVACLACCLDWLRTGTKRDRTLRLIVAPDGAARLVDGSGTTPVAAEVVGAWRLGRVLCLRLRPAGAQRDCRLLFLQGDVAPAQWHGLRRWQVWLRRSLNAH
jgi:hypothetical protein